MSEQLGHEPEKPRDREFAPVLREDDEALSPKQARAQGRKATGTGVTTSVPADRGDRNGRGGGGGRSGANEARSELEDPTAGTGEDRTGTHGDRGRNGGAGPAGQRR
ncbi:hypothetical protein GCM10027570_17030 [Streptomonospora sediminis]